MLSRFRSRFQAFARAKSPDTSEPARSGSCPRTMLQATPVRKPIIRRCGANRVMRPSRRMAGRDHQPAGDQGQEEERLCSRSTWAAPPFWSRVAQASAMSRVRRSTCSRLMVSLTSARMIFTRSALGGRV